MIKQELEQILQDLKVMNELDAHQLLVDCIQERLNTSLKTYFQDLTSNVEYLENKQEINILKTL